MSTEATIHVLIADDNVLVREGETVLLFSSGDHNTLLWESTAERFTR
jgi:serine kinase of HPr protein (carbohydrate metabolism regulator)